MFGANEKGELPEEVLKRSKTIPQGASTQCYAATAPELNGKSTSFFSNYSIPSR